MKDFMNCINPRIMYLDLDMATLIEHLVPPPEPHLLIGFVSLLGNFLLDTWLGFDDWLKSINVIQRGYQGRGWDGNNSNKIRVRKMCLRRSAQTKYAHVCADVGSDTLTETKNLNYLNQISETIFA